MKQIILLLSLFLVIASFNPAESATWNINNLVDFQARLSESQNNGENDTINVTAGTYNISSTLIYQPTEARTLTIQGDSAISTIFDGGNSYQIMRIDTTSGGNGADIAIRGLSFRNGNNSTNDGGGLFVEVGDATITIENCIFTNNGAYDNGGCVNAESESGGTIFFRYNTVSGTNHADNGAGGAIRINARPDGIVYFEYNTIAGVNSADASGGALNINTADNGTIYIRNNSFTGTNTSTSVGGAFYANTAGDGTLVISGNTVNGTNTGTRGGGIYANTSSDSTLNITNNTITGTNTANSGDGGGIYANTSSDSTLVFWGNTIYGNNSSTTYGGGASINGGSETTINVVNNTISGINSSMNGGGIRVNAPSSGILYFVNNTITGNSSTFTGGGAYIPLSSTANIYNNIIRNNTVSGPGITGDDLYVDTNGGNPVNFFNNVLGPNTDFITANSEDLVVNAITNYSQGSNSIADPLLGPLQDNGGPTYTRALSSGSPAINVGYNDILSTIDIITDQRGFPRIVSSTVDIGAYEYDSSVSIPAINQWGIIIFMVLAGMGSVYYLRRKRKS